jgi:hypothetical protein
MKRWPNKFTLLWLVPVLFLVHNIEEGLYMRETMDHVRAGMPRFLRVILPPVSYEQFLVSLILVTAVVFFLAIVGELDRERSWGVYCMLGVQMVLLLNVAAHLTTMVVVRSYTAGVATSLLVNLPFSVFLFQRAIRERWIGLAGFLLLIPAAAVIHVPVLFGFLYVSGFISRVLLGA